MKMKRLLAIALLLLTLTPLTASAWWNGDWSQRRKIVLNTTATGADVGEVLVQVPLLVRLHTGNFAFADAKPDGSDLRFVTADDKTPLKHHIEKFDGANELAVVWVQLPKLPANSDKEYVWLYYGNGKAPVADDAKGSYDAMQTAVFHFAEKDGQFADSGAAGIKPSQPGGQVDASGFIDGAALFSGQAMVLGAQPVLALAANGALTVSAWLRPDGAQQGAAIYSQEQGGKSVQFLVDGARLTARIGAAQLAGGELRPGVWQHVALTVGAGRTAIYLDGKEVANAAATLPDIQGEVKVGANYRGGLDEFQLARAARGAAWFKATAAQGAEDRLAVVAAETEEAESSGGTSYFGILIGNLTTDAWVVIIILAIMFIISSSVMVAKALLIQRVEKGNASFMHGFRQLGTGALLDLGNDNAPTLKDSSLRRLYEAGVNELRKRFAATAKEDLSAQSIDAIKASIDASLIRETHKLNAKMVLLTIAISGGPFLGLLGTVVGVMITFAAIAAAGDVNVNSIAPGIAAALLATVAGLGVAIPALFGYNWLASRIKTISADMHIFVDEFVTRMAEDYSR
ncbi:MAG: biopolymer transport protein ExbB [Rhodocyclaceae bacterium]|nr:MAG: biopolymer transport protein ExbB [Rhodocyclaceae bacterium]TNC99470.1 MAG: biopolymer transport protein ExbB [Rhodocyclaceae bacterium]